MTGRPARAPDAPIVVGQPPAACRLVVIDEQRRIDAGDVDIAVVLVAGDRQDVLDNARSHISHADGTVVKEAAVHAARSKMMRAFSLTRRSCCPANESATLDV
jgi:hypothetical protein